MEAVANVFLRKGAQDRLENGHPWMFKSEADYIDNDFEPGQIVDVYSHRQRFIGRGYINPRSQITVRILTREKETINEEFFRKRIETAWKYRQRFLDEPEYCRLVFAEADFLPALIIDKFGEYFVIQTLSLGIDVHKDIIVKILKEMFNPKCIYERNDVPVRKLEGLEMKTGVLYGEVEDLIKVKENGLTFLADIKNGQKTGFFYDQRENRRFLKDIVKDAEVLDCFCHVGSFAVHAAAYGAKKVTAIDISEHAIEVAKQNAKLNNVEDICDFRVANAFDYLRETSDLGTEKFDVVILDPPAFTKSRNAIEGAARGYKEINLRGLKLVKPGGFLITCSCSYHMDRELFKAIVVDAARDVKRSLREVEYRTQAKDHPILAASPETHYLKFLAVQVF